MNAAEDFEVFVAIVNAGSLSAAARELGLPRPTLSRRLARLEARLGVRLLHRTTRRLALTEEGQALYASARHVVSAAKEAESAVRRMDGVPRGLLRISLPAQMPQTLLAGWLRTFLDLHPELSIELNATTDAPDLVGGAVDVALRMGPIEDPSLVVRTLTRDLRIAVASPEYLAARGTPNNTAALAEHDCILGIHADGTPQRQWALMGGGTVRVSGRLTCNQMSQRLEAARKGLGIAVVIEGMATTAIATGELVQVLPEQLGHRESLCLCYADRRFLAPKIRAFVDFLSARILEIRARRQQAKPS